jgi:hypothetical protein
LVEANPFQWMNRIGASSFRLARNSGVWTFMNSLWGSEKAIDRQWIFVRRMKAQESMELRYVSEVEFIAWRFLRSRVPTFRNWVTATGKMFWMIAGWWLRVKIRFMNWFQTEFQVMFDILNCSNSFDLNICRMNIFVSMLNLLMNHLNISRFHDFTLPISSFSFHSSNFSSTFQWSFFNSTTIISMFTFFIFTTFGDHCSPDVEIWW